jgi:hypothetical protein
MSGGTWNYQQWHIHDDLPTELDKIKRFVQAIASSERIVDWAEAGDTVRRREDGSGAERDLYDLWLATFNEVYGDS